MDVRYQLNHSREKIETNLYILEEAAQLAEPIKWKARSFNTCMLALDLLDSMKNKATIQNIVNCWRHGATESLV